MTDFLPYVVAAMLLIVVLGYFNEKKTKLTYEIALMLFSLILGGLLVVIELATNNKELYEALEQIVTFDLEDYLMNGVLCFMLFSGSCHMKLADFGKLK
ncbi:MAG: hypothetical protein IJT96_00600, partial [Lachnospiraceae bacterium]|nr:hypothetical protein [Lachnospiraceae bacterium]